MLIVSIEKSGYSEMEDDGVDGWMRSVVETLTSLCESDESILTSSSAMNASLPPSDLPPLKHGTNATNRKEILIKSNYRKKKLCRVI